MKTEAAKKSRLAYNRRYYGKTKFAKKHKQPYTYEEEKLILDHFITDVEIAAKLGRSVGAIQRKRHKLINP